MTVTVHHGDCLDVLPTLGEVDAVVTDPPYGLKFMGKGWDHGIPGVPFWRETLRVIKPAGYMLCFGGTRTYHRLACAVEDAGFEIRDCLMWLYGSGFPKGKACLKPAWEPILLARKPGPKVLPLGIDACRIAGAVPKPGNINPTNASGTNGVYGLDKRLSRQSEWEPAAAGRWPANVVHDGSEEVRWLFAEFGERGSFLKRNYTGQKFNGDSGIYGHFGDKVTTTHADTGTAARFFYCAKASRRERGKGNTHPTVKPLSLLRWLVRMVTPEGGTVLDPFAGSGTTGLAATEEGRKAILIERESAYCEIIASRINATNAEAV